ncbi:Mu-like prophage protein gp36 [Nitrosomonas aestuarii]|uniref:Mu-like prophage protein gp36 n=1 Tax=Nitrosomonas aestuarii TaxID=52441 RepID=A0A1I4DIF2_9PROT|nr:DUF1320 domain-containing protein [Nitrosomonas aestuarii]SFK92267.1 Mu-like prophage protein gp36 [Nitrosomonas aestuarii]
MAYCTQQDMVDRFGNNDLVELTDRTQLGEIDVAVLNAAIADATGDIDMYLSIRYTLPLAVVPAVLTRLCCDIALFYLHGSTVTDAVSDRHGAAIDLLQSIAKGTTDLAVGEASGDGAEVAYSPGAKVFDESGNWP